MLTRGYAESIREYLTKREISDFVLHRKDSKTKHDDAEQHRYIKTRYVVERFFAWLNGFYRTRVRYEKNAQNYLEFVIISSIMMYFRVLG